MDTKISRFTLERYLAGELDAQDQGSLEAELDASPELRGRLETLKADTTAFEAEVPYARFRMEHERRKESRRRSRAPLIAILSTALLGAGAFALLFAPMEGDLPTRGDVRIKGADATLSFVVVHKGTARAALSGARVEGGDVLQLSYDAEDFAYYAVFGIDGSGAITDYTPSEGLETAALPDGASFPFSLTLDDTPGKERFIAFFTTHPVLRSVLRGQLEDSAGGLAWGVARAEIWVEKE